VVPVDRRLLEPGDRPRRLVAVRGPEVVAPLELGLLLLLGGPGQFELLLLGVAAGPPEGVHADDGQRTVVLALLVEHRLVLDAAALVRSEERRVGKERRTWGRRSAYKKKEAQRVE